ncbi:MAG TPA: DUF2585 family protein [Bauldia sp.]|nr:DUF2585 family protein [Bauldia sp.]
MTAETSGRDARIVAAGIAIFVLQAAILWWMGQPAINPGGNIDVWGNLEHSRHVLDWYTPSHLVHGFIFYGALWLVARHWSIDQRGLAALAIEAAWEVIENTPWVIGRYRDVTVSGDYVGDTIINSVFDLWAMLVGFWLASRLPVWLTIALAVALELGALIAVRDNLALNILMLLWPIDAIRVWQAA